MLAEACTLAVQLLGAVSDATAPPTALVSMMNRTPHQILKTLDSARTAADELQARLSTKRDVMDLGDFAHIQSTVKKIEDLLGEATEHEQVLLDRLHQTAVRVANLSGVDAADTHATPTGLAQGQD